ncbi:MAG: aldehyde dehydrogenase [Ferruginibacter sp.]
MFDIQRLQQMQAYYNSRATRSFAFRKEQLHKLKNAILRYEQPLHDALYSDLKKSKEESWVTETGFLVSEINNTLKHLKRWMQRELQRTNLVNLPSSSYVLKEPLGPVLIIGPWNYPLQLLFTPMVGAIAAGNCVVLKSSEFAPATSAVMKKVIEETFVPEYILFTEGDGATVIPEMMNNFRFAHVFYTGSTAVGKIIYAMAAEKLAAVTLELGGKSPCVVEADADIKVAARRIAMTKFSNAGQMCVAPDYVLVHNSVKEKFIDAIKKNLDQFFGTDAAESYNYSRIINQRQFQRIITYLKDGNIVYGGKSDEEKLYIQPTVIDNVSLDAPVMKDEIFGPVLPVISFDTMAEALQVIEKNPNPLAFYIYSSSNKKQQEWTEALAFGGGCINNSSWHLTNHHLPFGGIGNSGLGAYHGKNSFDVFTHRKAIMKTPTWFDPSIKYPPFKGKLKLFKWIIK